MKKLLVISALVLASSIASAVTVRGSGRFYTTTSIKTVKDACNQATQAARQSLTDKCTSLEGTVRSQDRITLDPVVGTLESFCTAYAEADCQ